MQPDIASTAFPKYQDRNQESHSQVIAVKVRQKRSTSFLNRQISRSTLCGDNAQTLICIKRYLKLERDAKQALLSLKLEGEDRRIINFPLLRILAETS